jgi:hypothetical protein
VVGSNKHADELSRPRSWNFKVLMLGFVTGSVFAVDAKGADCARRAPKGPRQSKGRYASRLRGSALEERLRAGRTAKGYGNFDRAF